MSSPSRPVEHPGVFVNGPFAGTRMLLYKEVLRFWKVAFQTVAAPVLTAVLYLLIFGHVLSDRRPSPGPVLPRRPPVWSVG